MNIHEIEDILRKKSSEESSSWSTSPLLDEKILKDAREPKEITPDRSRTRHFWIPVLVGATVCFCLALFVLPGQPRSKGMERDCLQFYAQLTKAINDRNVEQISSSYDNHSVGMNKGEMQSRLKTLFARYDSIDYRPGSIRVIADGSHAVIMNAFELTAVSPEGPVSLTGTERIYFKRTGKDIKVSLWVSE